MTWYPTYPEKAPPEPEEPGSAWLVLMESDSDYLYEAFGDYPDDAGELMYRLHQLTYHSQVATADIPDLIAEIRGIVEKTIIKYAAAKEEAGEELP